MVFLEINNYAIPVADGGSKEQVEEVGGRGIAIDGTELSDIRSRLGVWTASTPPLILSEATAISGLALGRGHSWDFEDATYWEYSGKGLGSSASSGASRQTSNPRWGSAHLRLAATTGSFSVDPGTTLDWTVLIWRDTGSGYEHYAITALGGAFLDGVATSFPSWVSVSSGVVTVANTSGSTVDYDGLVVLPYVATDSMIAAFASAAEAFSVLPRLTCRGDLFGDRVAVTAIGRDVSLAVAQGSRSSAWNNNLKAVQFGLREESRAMDPVLNGLDDPYSDWLGYWSAEQATGAGPYSWAATHGAGASALQATAAYSGGIATSPLSAIGIGATRVDGALSYGASGFHALSPTVVPSGDLHIRVPPFRPSSESTGYLFSWIFNGATDYITARFTSSTSITITWQSPSLAAYTTTVTVVDGDWHFLDLVVRPTGGAAGVAAMDVFLNGTDISPADHSVALSVPTSGRLGLGCYFSLGASPMSGALLGWGIRAATGIDLATHQSHVSLVGL